MLYYSYPQVTFQEVPGELSLALSISGCQLNCKGCHSPETFNPTFGFPLLQEVLDGLLIKHKHISCVLFYGGEWQPDTLVHFLKRIQSKNIKTALYTGLSLEEVPKSILPHLNYIKVGKYDKDLGPLGSDTTNQQFIELKGK